MKRYALMAALAFFLGNASQAAVIDLEPGNHERVNPPVQAVHDLAVTHHAYIVTSVSHHSELPEPEVFAMMLVGLILIGYRARRDSSDKFR